MLILRLHIAKALVYYVRSGQVALHRGGFDGTGARGYMVSNRAYLWYGDNHNGSGMAELEIKPDTIDVGASSVRWIGIPLRCKL